MDLEELLDDYIIDEDKVLSLVDEYSIFCHYIGKNLELGSKYSSPLRKGDSDPSFALYQSAKYGTISFRDAATGTTGNVFRFVKLLHNLNTLEEACKLINTDMGLGLLGEEFKASRKIVASTPECKGKCKIQVYKRQYSKEFLEYWYRKYLVTPEMLQYYRVLDVEYAYYTYKNFKYNKSIKCKQLTIGYPIGEYYKLYTPFAKEFKFVNDYPSTYVEGYLQLDWGRDDVLVITKATKECIVFRQHWNIQAIAGRSETSMIPRHIMVKVLSHFKRVILWLDQDKAGIQSMKKYVEMYPTLVPILLPSNVLQKDLTDILEVHGLDKTTNLLLNYKVL